MQYTYRFPGPTPALWNLSLGSAFLANQCWHTRPYRRQGPGPVMHMFTVSVLCSRERAAVAWPALLASQIWGSRTTEVSALPSSMTAKACSLVSRPRVARRYPERIFGGNHTFAFKFHLKYSEVSSPWKQVSKAHPFMKRRSLWW